MSNLVVSLVRGSVRTAYGAARHPITTASQAVGIATGAVRLGVGVVHGRIPGSPPEQGSPASSPTPSSDPVETTGTAAEQVARTASSVAAKAGDTAETVAAGADRTAETVTDAADEAAGTVADAAGRTADAVADAAHGTADTVARAAGTAADTVADGAGEVADKAGAVADQAGATTGASREQDTSTPEPAPPTGAPVEPVTKAPGEPEPSGPVRIPSPDEVAVRAAGPMPGQPGEAFSTEPKVASREAEHGGSAAGDQEAVDGFLDDMAAGEPESPIDAIGTTTAPSDPGEEAALLSESETMQRAAERNPDES